MLFFDKRLWENHFKCLTLSSVFTLYQIHADTCSHQFITGQVKKQKQKGDHKFCLTMYSGPITEYLFTKWLSKFSNIYWVSWVLRLNVQTRSPLLIAAMTITFGIHTGEQGSGVQRHGFGMADGFQSHPATNQLCHVSQITRLCGSWFPPLQTEVTESGDL